MSLILLLFPCGCGSTLGKIAGSLFGLPGLVFGFFRNGPAGNSRTVPVPLPEYSRRRHRVGDGGVAPGFRG